MSVTHSHFLLVICNGLSGGDSTEVSCFNDFLEFFKFVDSLFRGRGEMLDSTFCVSELLNQAPLDASFAEAEKYDRTKFIIKIIKL